MGQTFNATFNNTSGVIEEGQLVYLDSNATTPAALNATSPVGTITSGALPTASLSSGTGAQLVTTRDVNAYIALTADASNNVASAAIALSPDNTTYSTLATISLAAAVNNTGAIVQMATVRVPAGWYIKVTVVHMAITSTTYA